MTTTNAIYAMLRSRWGESNVHPPTAYHLRSSKKVFFKCPKCQQETVRMFSAIVDTPDACSVCSGKRVIAGFNDLATRSPHLAAEWSPRNEISPDQVIYTGSRRKAWFICSTCTYEWKVSIAFRVKNGNGCPRCAGQVIIPGVNDLGSQHPELLPEWNDTTPAEHVFAWSNKQYQWKCDAGHIWHATPAQRWDKSTNSPRQCNRCARSNRRSKGEQELATFVQTLVPDTIEVSYNALISNLELDIYLPQQHLAIEYNGEYWHSDAVLLQKYQQTAYMFHKHRAIQLAATGTCLYYVWEHDWIHHRALVEEALHQVCINKQPHALLQKYTHANLSCPHC